jgi:hypothetical protein
MDFSKFSNILYIFDNKWFKQKLRSKFKIISFSAGVGIFVLSVNAIFQFIIKLRSLHLHEYWNSRLAETIVKFFCVLRNIRKCVCGEGGGVARTGQLDLGIHVRMVDLVKSCWEVVCEYKLR